MGVFRTNFEIIYLLQNEQLCIKQYFPNTDDCPSL